ncbi:putative DNA-binding protein [Wigglesworthia glossinidia endosymbiont of Glossina morsitans morsitans (Yale colony)]|uniref:Putative DNA-binding protein n=1 Tax=Wigglesworthia glossinidia endosymbiont of Glossina morsitans morsitans (Yale colony) TaxID=1142511 RepID=H6Q4G4_WIGGL|nr:helix-turn-helix domain-containing protein [Wigglesworthia glossinidia]AFA41024.1 putative DNA-binding protein [Wigglesworthia glossinidia endosymbiont of Glossina morsitans morsitans (Yale colony)]
MNIGEKKNQITSNTIGKSLKKARENLGLSQKEIAKILRLKVSIIDNIENDAEHPHVSQTFLYGYIRAYANLVKLPKTELSLINNKMQSSFPRIKATSQIKSLKQYKKKDIWLVKITWLAIFIIVILIGTWWWQSYRINYQDILNIKTLQVEKKIKRDFKKVNDKN